MPVPQTVPGMFAFGRGGPNGVNFEKSDPASVFIPRATNAVAENTRPQQLTLRHHLKEVSAEDPSCIFVARQIHSLGFNSQKILREHFAQYGPVSRVLVAHRKIKGLSDSRGNPKTRPGSLGLIVMKRAATVKQIMALGPEQVVGGNQIRIEMYEPSKMSSDGLNDGEVSTAASSNNFSPHSSPGLQSSSDSGRDMCQQSSLEQTIHEAEEFIGQVPGF
jgi:hypothetical protein